jgi:mannose-6-phosphate isomerase-like protein (cupin superfamily)
MNNIRIIQKNVDISKILKQLKDNENDWYEVAKFDNIAGKTQPKNFLPITMGMIENYEQSIKDSNHQCNTIFYRKYTEIVKWLRNKNCQNHARAAFFRLNPGAKVGRHVDDGEYYLTKDRYHLSLQGVYRYECDGEEIIVYPGTFFWFNNKKYHEAENIGKIDRITFVFDVPHSSKNP